MQSSSSGCHENKNIISENTERHHLCPVAEEMYISPGTYAHWKKMPSFPCVFMMETLECMGRTSLRGPILMTQPSVLLQWKHRMNCISRAAQRPLPTLRLKNRIIKELESFVKKSLLKCSHDQMLFFFPHLFQWTIPTSTRLYPCCFWRQPGSPSSRSLYKLFPGLVSLYFSLQHCGRFSPFIT